MTMHKLQLVYTHFLFVLHVDTTVHCSFGGRFVSCRQSTCCLCHIDGVVPALNKGWCALHSCTSLVQGISRKLLCQ